MSIFRVHFLVLAVLTISLIGCTTPMPYARVADMDIDESREMIEELLVTQHRAWAPDYVQFNQKYVAWGGGFQDLIRIHYRYVDTVRLFSWKRKFRQGYVVQVVGKGDRSSTVVFRTRRLSDAKRFIDAFDSLRVGYSKLATNPFPSAVANRQRVIRSSPPRSDFGR